jgi:DNA-binding MarR family transcriptional regulator
LLRELDDVAGAPQTPVKAAMSDRVRAILYARRKRTHFFDSELFADPAWDILLELYAAHLGQYRTAVTSLCIGAAVPATTALRWIKLLETRGLILRRPDATDGRRVFMELSDTAVAAMDSLFSAVPSWEPLL